MRSTTAAAEDPAMTQPTRVATYHRVSTLDQDPALARQELRQAAARLGELVLEVEEVGSGARNDRPGWQRVLDSAHRGLVDVVVVWKLDRAGRSTLDLLSNIESLQGVGVRFLAVTQGLDFKPGGDAMSRLLLTVLSAVSAFERDLIRERTRLGLARAKREGKRLGKAPASPLKLAAGLERVAAGESIRSAARAVGLSAEALRRRVPRS